MLVNLLKNIISSGTYREEPTIHNAQVLFRYRLVTTIALVGLVIFSGTLVHEIVTSEMDELFITIIGIAMFFSILVLLRVLDNLEISITTTLITVTLIHAATILTGGFKDVALYYFFPLPIIVFLLTGKRSGLVWIGIQLLIQGTLTIIVLLGILQSPYHGMTLNMVFAAQINIALFALIYQSKKESSEALIKQQLYTHELTGLPNRRMLLEDIMRYKDPVLILIDINDFKEINHVFGPRVGDQILVKLAERIISAVTINDYLFYKLSADEYALLFYRDYHEYSINQFNRTADSIVFTVASEVFSGPSYDVRVGLTLGVADSRESSAENVLYEADIALQTAKNRHLSYMFSSQIEDLRPRFEENLKRLMMLADALEHERIVPYFQPIIDNTDSSLVKYECLVRLIKEDNTVVSPFMFLDVAKKAHLYPRITRLMIKNALDIFKETQCEFSINLSIEDILDPFTVQFLKLSILSCPEIGNRIVLEIVESEGIESFNEVLEFTREMKSLGCKIAIDDFGTGYSNFEYITKLFIDYLKIDGSLIKNLHTNYESRIIVENIVSIAKKLNIKTIAEYVHSQEILDIVKEMGIDYSQGFFLGQPSPTPSH
jgi:diguanylate cyclase (GGDEF)-like protein